MRGALTVGLTILVVSCSPASQVRSFTVEPPLVCPGQTAQVQWNVVGRASLREQRGAADWEEGEVPSSGSRMVAPASSTSFTITALDANRAGGNWQGNKNLQVASVPDSERAAVTTCDATSRKCTGTFTLDTTAALQVSSVSQPIVVRAGVSRPAAIDVTHGTWKQTVSAGQTVTVGQPANGAWTLQVDLGPNDSPTPPPQLRVHLDFACPHP